MRPHLSFWFAVIVAVGTAGSMQAQQAPPAPPAEKPATTFKARTELVSVPVIVTDKSGKHLTGLKQTDFVVEENGHRREIANFEEVMTSAAPIKRETQPKFQFSNFVDTGGQPRRITIIVLDLFNTPFAHQADARRQIVKFLADHLQDNGPTSLTVLNGRGLRQVHSFTSDTSVLIAALKKMESAPSVQDEIVTGTAIDPESSNPLNDLSASNSPTAEMQQLQEIFAERSDALYGAYKQRVQTLVTLDALNQLAESYAGIPGRKALIWTTGGLPFLLNDPNSISGIDTTLMDNYRRTWQALNSANISVYPIDAQGLLGPDLTARGMNASRPMRPNNGRGLPPPTPLPVSARQNAQDSLRAFAQATGGTACINQNDLASCFARAEQDSSQYYLLSYYLPENDRKPGWRKLKVHVAPAHGEIRARDGFYVGDTPPPDSKSARQEFDLAFASPLEYTAIPLALSFTGVTPADGGARTVAFKLHFVSNGIFIDTAENNAVRLEIDSIATDEKGKSVRVFSKVINAHLKADALPNVTQNGFRFSGEFNLAKGRYQLKFVVRDDLAGKIGSVAAPVQID